MKSSCILIAILWSVNVLHGQDTLRVTTELDTVLAYPQQEFELNWQGNGFTELPPSLQTAQNIQSLRLDNSRLTTIPDWLQMLIARENEKECIKKMLGHVKVNL